MDADGTSVVRASTTGNREDGDSWYSCPEWSPNGSRIAFSALARNDSGDYKFVFAVNPDGTNQRRLSPGDSSEPVWSPDGKSIVFSNDGALGELWVMNPGGSGRRRLVQGRPDDDFLVPGAPYSEADQVDWAAGRRDG